MATYFVGDERAASSSGGARGGASGDNYLRSLAQLAESESRQKYFDYLMGAEGRKDAQFERVKETDLEAFRRTLKRDVIAEKITNDANFAKYTGLGKQRAAITSPDGTGALDALRSRMSNEYPVVPMPDFMDSQTVSAIVKAEEGRYRQEIIDLSDRGELDPDEASEAVNDVARRSAALSITLNSISNYNKRLKTINANMAAIPGAGVELDGVTPTSFTPMNNMYGLFVAEFGEDPFTGSKIEPEDRPPKPSPEEVSRASSDVAPVREALENEGALDDVEADTPIPNSWLTSLSDLSLIHI